MDFSRDPTLDDLVKTKQFVVVTAVRPKALTTAGGAFRTWTVFNVDEALTPTIRSNRQCREAVPSSLPMSASSLVVGFMGGTHTVEGIDVTWISLDSQLQIMRGARYLLIGDKCADHQLEMAFPGSGLIDIGPDGRFQAQLAQPLDGPPQFFRELMSIGTVENLKRVLHSTRVYDLGASGLTAFVR